MSCNPRCYADHAGKPCPGRTAAPRAGGLDPVAQARNGVASILVAMSRARTSNEREEIARIVARLTDRRTIAEMAAEALTATKEPGA